mmetsp:Transcript_20769/g.79568  ORF Transcript_20769/g.79568 Transcript_20769/m.79568 type:complete len:365 (-) Transcript_20769:735-1829(-)
MAQVHRRVRASGDGDLGAFRARGQFVAQALLQHRHQPGMLAHIAEPGLHAAPFGHPLRRVAGVDQVPGGQVEVEPAGQLAPARAGAAVAEGLQQAGQFDVAVEVGAGDVDAVAGENVVAARQAPGAFGPDANDREVAGAAADVGHQHDLLAAAFADGLLLEVEGRRDRLVLELHIVEADRAGAGLELGLGGSVARRLAVDEKHRPPEHHPGRLAGQAAQALQVTGDDVRILGAAAAADVGGLVDQGGAEDALHRAHQPAIVALDIGGHGGPAEGPWRSVGVVPAFGKVENGGRHRALARLQLHQAHRAVVTGHRHGGIRGAEVDGAETGGGDHGAVRGIRPALGPVLRGGRDSRNTIRADKEIP